MILSDKTIKSLLASGQMAITPLDASQIQPASVDFCPGNTFSIPLCAAGQAVTMDTHCPYETVTTEQYTIGPGAFVLATTKEYFRLPNNMTAFVEGRSSVGRMGLFI